MALCYDRAVATDYHNGIRALLCTEDGRERSDLGPDEIDRFIAVEGNLLWLDIDSSVTTDLSLLKQEFGFHDLALEDALRPHQRPKIESFEGYFFLVFYAIGTRQWRTQPGGQGRDGDSADPAQGELDFGREVLQPHQIAMFIGTNFLVTVHHGAPAAVTEIAERWHGNIQRIDRSISTLVYSLLDAIVDGYFPVIDQVADVVEDIEEQIFEKFDQKALESIFALKKSLLAMRRVVAPERDVLNVLIRRDVPLLGASSVIYFQDVYDHVVRVTDSIDTYRDLLSSALDAYLSIASNRLNEVMRTLASWSIPLMAGALLAGIWGMNFRYMPELEYRSGYLFALGTIALTIGGTVVLFRTKRWL